MATLEVLGMQCRSCVGLLRNVQEAMRQERRSDYVEKVTDYTRILALNPWRCPLWQSMARSSWQVGLRRRPRFESCL